MTQRLRKLQVACARGVRRSKRWLIGLIAVILVVTGAFLVRVRQGEASAPSSLAVPVTTTRVVARDVPIEIDALGRVAALNTVLIRPQVGGQVIAIDFTDGQYVKRGERLVEIDPRPLAATVAQDQASVARARANLDSAQADLDRYVPLASKGIVSTQQVSDQRAQVAQLRATVSAAQATLEHDRVQLGYTTITAPLDGVLGLRQVDVGNMVDPANPAGVVVLTQAQPITVLFPVPQDQILDVEMRQEANKAGLTVEAWSQDGRRRLDVGVLSALSNVVDASTGTMMLKAVFPNLQRLLWPGESVSVRLVLEVEHQALSIPVAAVNDGPAGPYVWAIAPGQVAAQKAVTIRQERRGEALIAEGVSPGDEIVTNGQYGLTSGAHVRVEPAGKAAPDAAHGLASEGMASLRTIPAGRLGISP